MIYVWVRVRWKRGMMLGMVMWLRLRWRRGTREGFRVKLKVVMWMRLRWIGKKKGRIQSGDDCDIEDEEVEGEFERIIMEDYDNEDVDKVHTKSKDSSWLRDPNEELKDVEVHIEFYKY